MEKASIILRGNAIFDGTGNKPFKGSIVIFENKIKTVLKNNKADRYIGPDTKVLDYEDELIMPGFNDAHTHFTQGSFLEDKDFALNVLPAKSKKEAILMTRKFAEAHPQNEWVYGYMVDDQGWDDQTVLTKADIDKEIPDRPVVLQMADLHTIVVNEAAIQKSELIKRKDQYKDGMIQTDENGELTGRLFDGACFDFLDLIFRASDEQYERIYERFFEKIAAYGITSLSLMSPYTVHDDPVPYLKSLEGKGKLSARVLLYPNINEYKKERFQTLKLQPMDEKIRIQGLKQLLDGVTTVHTAYLLDPYENGPTTCGSPSIDLKQFKTQALEAIKEGIALRIHTIGDRAVREMLDIFEEGIKRYGKRDIRHVQEHLETVHPDDMKRFAELGVSCCIQPWHMLFDLEGGDMGNGLYGYKEAAVGKERAKHSWPIRELLDAGAVVSFGSDYPVVGIDPFKEIYAAITRQTFDGKPEGGWFKEQRITIAEALKAYTWGSAYAEGCEQEFGIIKEGMLADVIVLDRNLFKIKPKEILDTKVLVTIMDGEIVYQRK